MKLARNPFFIALTAMLISACGTSTRKNNADKLVIFHAGSMTMPIKAAVDSFTRMHPGVVILTEAAGSVECGRKITELGKKCDLFVSADYKVIDQLISLHFASWNIPFAGNEMVLVYRPDAPMAETINATNWLNVLLQGTVRYGRSDPNTDPCGYRTEMVLKLAESFFNRPGVADSVLSKDTKYIRPKEVDLLALLEVGAIDYLFIYRSVALQHGLRFIELPREVNLSSPDLAGRYASVEVKIRGQKPDTFVTLKGEPMVYGLTIPNNAPNKELAVKFTRFFLSKQGGLAIVEQMGQNPLVPSPIPTYNSLPEALKEFASPQD